MIAAWLVHWVRLNLMFVKTPLMPRAGVNLGQPGALLGVCQDFMTLGFEPEPLNLFSVTLDLEPTPLHGTNVSSLNVRHLKANTSRVVFTPDRKLLAARKRCYDCAADLTFHSGKHNFTISHLRIQVGMGRGWVEWG